MNFRMHPAVEIIRLGETKWQIIGGAQRHTICAPAGFMEAMITACGNSFTKQHIICSLEPRYGRDRVATFFDFLVQRRYLIGDEPAVSSNERLIETLDLRSRSLPATAVSARNSRSLLDCMVGIVGVGVIAEQACGQLDDIGCRFGCNAEILANGDYDLALVCSDRLDHDFFRNVNRQAVASHLATLFVALDGARIIVGPFIDPPATACFECFHTRLRGNARHLAELDGRVGGQDNILLRLPPSRLLARWSASVAVAKLAAHAAGVRFDHPAGEVLDIDGVTRRTETRRLLKLPRCGVCGPGGVERPRALIYEF